MRQARRSIRHGWREITEFDPLTGKEQKRIRNISDPYQIGFSPDGKWFVSNSLRLDRVDLYDAADFKLKARLHAGLAPLGFHFLGPAPDSLAASAITTIEKTRGLFLDTGDGSFRTYARAAFQDWIRYAGVTGGDSYVDPTEWWDAKWVREKIEEVGALAPEPAPEAPAARKARRDRAGGTASKRLRVDFAADRVMVPSPEVVRSVAGAAGGCVPWRTRRPGRSPIRSTDRIP